MMKEYLGAVAHRGYRKLLELSWNDGEFKTCEKLLRKDKKAKKSSQNCLSSKLMIGMRGVIPPIFDKIATPHR